MFTFADDVAVNGTNRIIENLKEMLNPALE